MSEMETADELLADGTAKLQNALSSTVPVELTRTRCKSSVHHDWNSYNKSRESKEKTRSSKRETEAD